MILVRFQWSSLDPDRARWEQAFSADAGRSWETNWIMEFRRAPAQSCCAVLELRQYELHSGQRETLIDLFAREFIEPQEALGMTLIGPFATWTGRTCLHGCVASPTCRHARLR